MFDHSPTVIVDMIHGYPALKMTWRNNIRKADVSVAFDRIADFLDQAGETIHVVVDITSNPVFPLRETISGAMRPFGHRYMGLWLVVGSNPLARIIEGSLKLATRRDSVKWFKNLDDAIKYLDDMSD